MKRGMEMDGGGRQTRVHSLAMTGPGGLFVPDLSNVGNEKERERERERIDEKDEEEKRKRVLHHLPFCIHKSREQKYVQQIQWLTSNTSKPCGSGETYHRERGKDDTHINSIKMTDIGIEEVEEGRGPKCVCVCEK